MAYVQYDNERESFEMYRTSDDVKIFAPQYRAAIEQAREALGYFMEPLGRSQISRACDEFFPRNRERRDFSGAS